MVEPYLERESNDRGPLVSVIIPAYNAERFIGQTLESVLAQTYANFEVLVVDDGSTDETVALVHSYAAQDSRIKLQQQANAGVAAARNAGIQAATGELLAPLDADDLWYPHHLQQQVQCFLRSPVSVGVVYSWSVDIDEQDRLTGGMRAAEISGDVYKTLVCHNFLGNASATMMRRSCLEQVGNYDITLRARHGQGCEDWDLYLRMAERFQFQAVSTFSVGYRKCQDSMSKNYDQMARSHSLVMEKVRQQHPELSKFLFRLSASNLYFYFAAQSKAGADFAAALFWLQQAVRADRITCWIHPELYQILLLSCRRWRIVQYLIRHLKWLPSLTASAPQLTDIRQRQSTINRLLIKENSFHWVITKLARKPLTSSLHLTLTPEGHTP